MFILNREGGRPPRAVLRISGNVGPTFVVALSLHVALSSSFPPLTALFLPLPILSFFLPRPSTLQPASWLPKERGMERWQGHRMLETDLFAFQRKRLFKIMIVGNVCSGNQVRVFFYISRI